MEKESRHGRKCHLSLWAAPGFYVLIFLFVGFGVLGMAKYLYPENYTWFVCYSLAIILYPTVFFSCPSFWDVSSSLFWSPFPSWFPQCTYITGPPITASAPLDDQFLQSWCLGLGIFDSNRTDCTLWTFQMFQTLQVLSIAQSVCVPVPLYGTWQCYFSSGENNPLCSSSRWPFSSHFNLWPSHMPPEWLILARQHSQNSEIKVFPSITFTLLPCPSNQGLSNAPT